MSDTKIERGLQITANVATVLSAMRGVTYVSVIVSVSVLGFKVLPILDRVVIVLENLDDKVDRAFEGAVPIAKDAVTKGTEAIKNVDAKKVGNNISDAIRLRLKGKK